MKSRPTEAKPSYYVHYFYNLSQCFKITRLPSTSVTTTHEPLLLCINLYQKKNEITKLG